MKILITGAAGFVGSFAVKDCLSKGYEVVAVDDLNDYYSVGLKLDRLKELGISGDNFISQNPKLCFYKLDISHHEKMLELFHRENFDYVLHMAAQAGVRFSIDNPRKYFKSNCDGFLNILEGCRHTQVKHLIYASSSSVYGANTKIPFQVKDPVDHPLSIYATTKRSNELMAHTYSHLFQLPTTGLRYFTVYGPWGRPDMAPCLFADSILKGQPIEVFNQGDMERDFTYVEDIVEAQSRLIKLPPSPGNNRSTPDISIAPFKIYNIGSSRPIKLMDFLSTLEQHLGVKASINLRPMQPGDVPRTYADVEDLFTKIDYRPTTSLDQGVKSFVKWFKSYYSH